MGVAAGAASFRTGHAVGAIGVLADILLISGSKEAGPAGAGLEFGLGIEQRSATAHAGIHSFFVIVPVLAGEGTLGSGFPHHVVLLSGKLLAPFGFGLGDFFGQFFGHISLLR